MRLELTTPCLKGRCSNLLSYGPVDSASIALVAVECQAEEALDSSSLFQNSSFSSVRDYTSLPHPVRYKDLLLSSKDSIISLRESKYIKIPASLINPTERPRFGRNKLTHQQHNSLMITNDVVATANSPNMAAHNVLRWHRWWSGTSPVVAIRCVVVAYCS